MGPGACGIQWQEQEKGNRPVATGVPLPIPVVACSAQCRLQTSIGLGHWRGYQAKTRSPGTSRRQRALAVNGKVKLK